MCDAHRGYKAVRKPRVDCLDCWMEWMEKHPEYSMEAKDLRSMFVALRQEVKTADRGARFAVSLASRGAL